MDGFALLLGLRDKGRRVFGSAAARRDRTFSAFVRSCAGLALAWSAPASAQIAPGAGSGVRHEVRVSIALDPVADKQQDQYDKGRITVTLIISDHSREASFYGGVAAAFPDFDPRRAERPQTIWAETICHQNRGLPKLSVTRIEGVLASGRLENPVAAVPRQIGERLPNDEIATAHNLTSGFDQDGAFMEQKARTLSSHLMVDAKIYTFPCDVLGRRPS